MKKISIILVFLPAICFSDVNYNTKVHRYCEVKYKSEANIILSPVNNKMYAQMCAHIETTCVYVDSKAYIDRSGIPTYFSRNNNICE